MTANPQTGHKKANRLERLDILRGLAALVVVLFHYTVQFPAFYPAGETFLAVPFGFYGVHLFFLISGFVILMSLDRRNGSGFIKSRFIRLYPVFWASVLLTAAVLYTNRLFPFELSAAKLLVNLAMLPNYLKVDMIDGVYWSLAYELGFYAMMFAVYRLGLQRRIEWVQVWMICGTVIFMIAPRYVPHPLHLLAGMNSYSHLFAGGLALYLANTRGWSAIHVLTLATIPLIQFAQDGLIGAAFVALSIGFMIWAVSSTSPLTRLAKPLIWLGSVSYALYLTHQMIGYVALGELQAAGYGPVASFSITFVGAITLAAILTYGVERPSARWLKKNLQWPTWHLRFFSQAPKESRLDPL